MPIFISIRLFKGAKYDFFLLFYVCKIRNLGDWGRISPRRTDFSAQNEISGKKISRTEEKNTPKKVFFAPKVAESDEKERFWLGNRREGIERKTDLTTDFAML